MSKNSVTEEKYEVGDVIRVSDGSTATIWKGLIKEKVGHIDMEGIFMQMEHDLLVGGE